MKTASHMTSKELKARATPKGGAKKPHAKKRPSKLVGSGSSGSPLIPASKLLRAEATRLNVLKRAMPDAAQGLIDGQVWAFNMAAAFLDSLGAPEKLERYVPANPADEPRAAKTNDPKQP